MSFQYPVTIARDVVTASRFLKREAFEPHGPGILEKIFDIGCSLADVLQLYPVSQNTLVSSMQIGPRDYLMEMIRLCSTVLGGSSRYVSLLSTKADECFHSGPRAINSGSSGRVVELEEDDDSFDNDQSPIYDVDVNGFVPNDVDMFDFGSLSDVSMAWLGSISNEPNFEVDPLQEEGMYEYSG